MKTIPLIYFIAQLQKQAKVDETRAGLYNMIPLFGNSAAAASMNLQDPSRATAGRSLRDKLLMLLGTLGGAAGGAAAGGMAGSLFAGPSGTTAGMALGGIGGMLGGSYLSGTQAARWRNQDKEVKGPEERQRHSTLLALLDPYAASSLHEKETGNVLLKGTAGMLGGGLGSAAGSLFGRSMDSAGGAQFTPASHLAMMVGSFGGRALAHSALHDKKAAETQPQIGFLDALKVLKAQATGEQPNESQLRQLMESRMWSNLGSSVGRGTAIGALGGVGVQALRRVDEPDPKKKPSLLNGLLMGGLLGAGAGGAVGIPYGFDGMRQVYNETPIGKVRPMSVTELLDAVMGRQPAPQQ